MSCFAQLDREVRARGTERLRADLASGAWDAKYGASARRSTELDLGYRLLVAGRCSYPDPPCCDWCCRRARWNGRRCSCSRTPTSRSCGPPTSTTAATIDDPRVIDVTILRPQEIPRYVADGLVRPRHHGPRLDRGDGRRRRRRSPSCTTRRRPRGRSGWCSRSAGDAPWKSVKDLPAGVRVHTEYPELTRRFLEKHGVDAEISLVVRRDRGEDPRDRRRGRRDHRDRPGAARRPGSRCSTRSSSRTPS